MKTRNGFVSNSSSSSFVVYGKEFSYEEFQERFKITDDELESIYENGVEDALDKARMKEVFKDVLWPYNINGDYWVVGTTLKGKSVDIIKGMNSVDKELGSDCEFFNGIDSDGNLCFD